MTAGRAKVVEAWAIVIDGERFAAADDGAPILYVEDNARRLAALYPNAVATRVKITPTPMSDSEVRTVLRAANAVATRMETEIKRLTAERDGEREARQNCERALAAKDKAMGVLFDRLQAAGVDCSDLVP